MGYIFDPDVLHEVVRGAVGQPIERVIDQIVTELSARHPGHILSDRAWVFNNAGGAMGSMLVLHASLREYVIIFGSAIGTEGASGRFPADDWFFVLEGEHWSYGQGDLEKTVTRAGEVARLRRGEAKAYRLPDRCWALEYARGAIPLMLPFGFADTFTSTLDFVTFGRTMKIYGRALLGSTRTSLEGSALGRLVARPRPPRRATPSPLHDGGNGKKRPNGSITRANGQAG